MKRFIRLILIELIMIFVFCENVLAVSSAKVNLLLQEVAVKGDTIKAILVIENADGNISGIQGKLTYETDVLEYVSCKSVLDNWFVSGYNKETGIFLAEATNVADTESYIFGTKNVVEFTFKVKENTGATKTEIKISEIVLSGAISENTSITKELSIIEKKQENKADNNEQNNNENNNQVNNNNAENIGNNGSKQEENKQDNNDKDNLKQQNNDTDATITDEKKLPYTGNNKTVIITALSILLFTILGYIFYKKVEKYRGI